MSKRLGIPYLSEYNGTYEDLLKIHEYVGPIIGTYYKLFFSIPTALKIPNSSETKAPKFFYVHYLLNTGSPISTLTYEAYTKLMG